MNIIDFHKNFSLLEEVEIASKFICNGLDEFDRMTNFMKNEDLFHVFYSLSVGIERFQKSCLLLLWEITEDNAKSYEEKLITHSLSELNREIKKINPIKFCPQDNALISLLEHFYISLRYFRYNISKYSGFTEKDALDNYLFEQYKIHSQPEDSHILFFDVDESLIKEMIGRSVSRICFKYHTLIEEAVAHENHALHELCYQPNYARLFCQETDRSRAGSSVAKRMVQNRFISALEAIIFIANTEQTSGHMDYMKQLKPLDLDIAFMPDYINSLAKGVVSNEMIDEITCAYDELDDVQNRLDDLYPIYTSAITFEMDLEEDMEDDFVK